MAEWWVNDAGTPRQIASIYNNDAGNARRILEVWVNDAGTARRIFLGDIVDLPITNASRSVSAPSTAIASYALTSAGDIETTLAGTGATDRGDWITPQINMAGYECRAGGATGVMTTGTLTTGTLGTWQSLSATRTWTKNAVAGGGAQSCSFLLEIRSIATNEVVASATITMTAQST